MVCIIYKVNRDDDQSIYGFRGSKPDIFNDFLNDYGEVTKIFLSDNYRCGAKIVKLANKVINNNKNRFIKDIVSHHDDDKVCFMLMNNRNDEIDSIISTLKQMKYEDQNSSAIILRTNLDVAIYSSELNKRQINIKNNKKISIFDSFIMDDITSFLRFIFEIKSRDLFIRFMNKPNRYISREALINEEVDKENLLNYYQNNEIMLKKINQLFSYLKLAAEMNIKLAICLFRKNIGYNIYLKQISKSVEEYENRLKIADEIENFFMKYKKGINILDYIQENKFLYEKNIKLNSDKEGIEVLTMHTAKGLEYKNVFLPDINEGIIPSLKSDSISLEEERRLLYVAITRAKNRLYIYATKERNRDISRFIKPYINEKDLY